MIYLDNASTTRIRSEARAAMADAPFGNPSSLHASGRAARKALEDARERIADRFGADPRDLVFTSGATEADNLAVFGVARARRAERNHLLVSAVEHPAVLEAARSLQSEGFEVETIPVDGDGRVDPGDVERRIRPRTALVSVMAGNNEVGTLQPVKEIARIARERRVPFHTDAAQALTRVPFRLDADLVTLSSHKIHGPRGAGALYVRRGTPLVPRQVGGGQEFERRSGTEAVEAILGFAAAVAAGEDAREADAARIERLRRRFEEGLAESCAPVRINGAPRDRLPHIANLSFPGADGEAMIIALDARGVHVSSGSACASQSLLPSHVLKAMGRPDGEVRSSVRFSLGIDTTEEEIVEALRIVPEVVGRLRAISPFGAGR